MRSPTVDLGARDPAFIRANLPGFVRVFRRYHKATVEGLEEIPEGAALVVGNHNGGVASPDMFALMVAWWERFGPDAAAYGLAHDLAFRVPVLKTLLARVGALPAGHEVARSALAQGARVLVYPGGDLDAYRPWSRRHEIVFGPRRGFIRLALQAGVPIVPVVSIGAHESFFVITDGAEFARRSGLKGLTRMEVLPVIAGLPWGLWVGALPHLPLPTKMRLRVLPPLAWPSLDASAAEDPAKVERCFEEVRGVMQSALDQMRREGGYGRRSLGEILTDA